MSATAAAAGTQQNGVLEVLTFTGTQPFVVRCERDTRVKDIVGAIAEIWGFKEAARLFTLCQPAPGSNLSDPTKIFPGTLLSWTDSPCQVAAATAAAAAAAAPAPGSEPSSQDGTTATAAAGAAGSATPTPTAAAPAGQQRLLLVRYIFGSTASEWDQNHSVLSLTAAQIAADVAAARYPGVAEAGLYQHWVKQGQHSVVLHMAASWPSGACLIVGPATVLSAGAAMQSGPAPINLGLNSKGIHIMSPQQHKLLLPLDSIVSATPAGDVLNIRFAFGQPDLLLQLPGAEAVAEAFKFHQTAAGPRPLTNAQPAAAASSSAAGSSSGPASGKRGAPHMPLWITSPSVERWLQEPTPKDDGQAVSVSIKVLRPWEQTPPALRVLLTAEEPTPDDRLLEAQLLVVEEDEEPEGEATAAAATAGDDAGAAAGAVGTAADAAQQKQPRVKLHLRLRQQPQPAPEPRVKLTIAPVPEAEQELLMPAPGEEPLVRLVIKPRGERPGAASSRSPLNMLRMLHKGADAGLEGAADGVMLRGMQLGGMAGVGAVRVDERPHPQLMQRLQQQQAQQQEVRQGLLAGTHLGGPMGQQGFQGPGMRPAYGVRPSYGAGAGYRPNMGAGGMQQQGPGGWQQQQQYGAGGMMGARPPGMRPMGALPHQPYALAGPPNNMMGGGQGQHRPGMTQGGMHNTMQGRPMRPQQQQQYPGQMHQQQQQQYGGMRQQPQQPQQQQYMMQQQGGYMVVQQPRQQMQQPMMQHQQQAAYIAMPQQHQQPQQQHMMMMQANPNAGMTGGNMVLVTTADGRQLLMHDSQLAQPQQQAQQLVAQQQMQQAQQQQAVMPGVFVLGAQGELMPASQPGGGAAQHAAPGMQQMMLQQPAQLQQQPMMVAQGQGGQPMFVQPTPSQKLQQFQQAQQMQQVQYQQPQQQQAQQQQRQMGGMAGLGQAGGQYDQLHSLMAQPQQQQQQQQLMQQQAQPMGMVGMDMNGQLQLQAQQAHQQQFVAVSSAAVGGQATQLLQLQGMQGLVGTSASMAQPGFVLQGQQQQQPQQQQQILVDSSNMGLLQQQMPRNSNGTNMVMTSAGMFGGQQGLAAPGLGAGSGPASNGGGINSLGLLQQGAPGLVGIPGSAAPGLSGMSLGGGMGGMGGVGGLGAAGNSYLNSFDALRQPNSTNSGLGLGGGAQTTADPPGLNYGSAGQAPGSFLQQQQQPQQQQQQQQMFTLTNDVGGVTGLGGGQDGLQGGLQGGVLSDGYMLSNDGMTLTGGAPGLAAPAFGTQQQQFNTPGFY